MKDPCYFQEARLAEVLLAEIVSAREGKPAAEELWHRLGAPRRLYGALRLKGLLPMATADLVQPAASPPEPTDGADAQPASP